MSYRPTILYISYDGMAEPLGQSQVLAYLDHLASDYAIHLVSFEKPADLADATLIAALRERISAAGINWTPLLYHKRPTALATGYDIARGIFVGAWAVTRHSIEIIHARSYVASVVALALKRLFGLRYIFDMRGFWADERVDGGLWPAGGRLYGMAKRFERRFLLSADCVVSLTHAAVDEMRTFRYLQGRMPRFEVITTCADLELFKPADRALDPCIDRPFTLGYVGSVGVWYLLDEALRLFKLLWERVPNTRLHILNRGEHAHIRERMAALGIDENRVLLEATDRAGVACAMQRMDAGVFFIKPLYSKIASAPTKLGEFLSCGVPCLANAGVGDMADILDGEGVGVVISAFDDTAMREAVQQLVELTRTPDIGGRCRAAALRRFSLEEGVTSYRRIYQGLEYKDA